MSQRQYGAGASGFSIHEPRLTPSRDWWLTVGLAVSASSALISSFGGLYGLGRAAGWDSWMAPLLPLTVDSYALSASRVWLASNSSAQARKFARWNTLLAIVLSLVGNATYHAMAAGLFTVSWVIVVVVGAVPPAVLGFISHLAALRGSADAAVLPVVPGSGGRTESGSQYGTPDDLLAAARATDAAHRAQYGRGITRDALRRALRISAARATTTLRQLKDEEDALPPSAQKDSAL